MDHVAKTTHHQPPQGPNLAPGNSGLGGCALKCDDDVSIICASLLLPSKCSVRVFGPSRKERRGPPAPLSPHRASNLAPSGTRTPCTSTMLAIENPTADVRGRALSVYQEQLLFMG